MRIYNFINRKCFITIEILYGRIFLRVVSLTIKIYRARFIKNKTYNITAQNTNNHLLDKKRLKLAFVWLLQPFFPFKKKKFTKVYAPAGKNGAWPFYEFLTCNETQSNF